MKRELRRTGRGSVGRVRGLAAVAVLAATAAPLPAQSVQGVVESTATDLPIAGAEVSLALAGGRVATDEGGGFAVAASSGDTLVVRHDDYHPVRLPLGATEGLSGLTVRLRPAMPIGSASDAYARHRREAIDLAIRSGGFLWDTDDFRPYVQTSAHPLELLLFSGLVESVGDEGAGRWCVRIVGQDECAEVRLGESARARPSQLLRHAAEVAAFVVVRPGATARALGDQSGAGVVAVYFIDRRAP